MWDAETPRRTIEDYFAVGGKAEAAWNKTSSSKESWPGEAVDPIEPRANTLLPWPSLGWQQTALAAAIVLGLLVAWAGLEAMDGLEHMGGGLGYFLGGSVLTAMAAYAGWTTRWLTRTPMAPPSRQTSRRIGDRHRCR